MAKKTFDPKTHLQKHGWEDGSGLGKNEHGIKEAIKVKIKADSAGVGHNRGEEFTFHWWDHMFNKAANNIKVENSQEGVKVKKAEELEISTKKGLAKTLANKDLLYGRFVKAATLTDQGVEVQETPVNSDSDSDDSADEDIGSLSKVSDAMLMKVCGGRTAHKAARHGLGLSGKLSRVAEQDQAFVSTVTASPTPTDTQEEEEDTGTSKCRSKKRKHKDKGGVDGECKSKKVKKKKSDREELPEVNGDTDAPTVGLELSSDSGVIEDETAEVPEKRSKKKKKKRNRECDSLAEQCLTKDFAVLKKSKSKKKKKQK